MSRNVNAELEEEMKEGEEDSEEEDLPEQEVPIGSVKTTRRGRPKLPLTWTRVLHITSELNITTVGH